MPVPCRYCGANLDSYSDFCGCSQSVEVRRLNKNAAPIAAKRNLASKAEIAQRKNGNMNFALKCKENEKA